MTSPARININRQNSKASTGPRTRAGKARSSQNAKRHALTIPVQLVDTLEPEIDALARLIAPEGAGPDCHRAARGIAEAQIDLNRVKTARFAILNQQDQTCDAASMFCALARDLLRLERYETRALSRRKEAVRKFHLSLFR